MAESSSSKLQTTAVVTWSVHLARRQPWRAAAAVFLVCASAAAAYLIWPHPLAAAVAGFLVLSAAAEFLLPIKYRIGPEGVSCRNFLSLRQIKWADVKHCYRDADGVKLSPLARPSRLEAYRGIYLWLGGEGEAVLEAVRRYLPGGSR